MILVIVDCLPSGQSTANYKRDSMDYIVVWSETRRVSTRPSLCSQDIRYVSSGEHGSLAPKYSQVSLTNLKNFQVFRRL